MKRRDILIGAGSLAAVASTSFPSPAIAQGARELKMVTDWPEGLPGFYPSAVRFAETVRAATSGRIKIQVFLAGAFVGPLETFDAVSAGVAECTIRTRDISKRNRKHSISFPLFRLASRRTNCSRGFNT